MRPQDYHGLLRDVASHGARLDVVRDRLSIDGELPEDLELRVREWERDLIPLLLADRHIEAREAAVQVWEWLEAGMLADVDTPISLRPGDTIPPESLERAIRVELQRAKAPAHLGQVSRRNLQVIHAALDPLIKSQRVSRRPAD